MKKISKIQINPLIFFNALNNPTKLKRSPAGGRGKISKSTTLSQYSKNKLLIETPFVTNIIEIDGMWNDEVEINAVLLEKIAKALVKSDTLEVSVSNKELIIEGKTKFTIPLI